MFFLSNFLLLNTDISKVYFPEMFCDYFLLRIGDFWQKCFPYLLFLLHLTWLKCAVVLKSRGLKTVKHMKQIIVRLWGPSSALDAGDLWLCCNRAQKPPSCLTERSGFCDLQIFPSALPSESRRFTSAQMRSHLLTWLQGSINIYVPLFLFEK